MSTLELQVGSRHIIDYERRGLKLLLLLALILVLELWLAAAVDLLLLLLLVLLGQQRLRVVRGQAAAGVRGHHLRVLPDEIGYLEGLQKRNKIIFL